MQFLPLSMKRHAPAAHASPLEGAKSAVSFTPAFVAAVVAFVVAGTFFVDRAANAGVIGDIMALVLAYIFQMIAMGLGQLLLIVINGLIWVYQYNGFVTAAPVANGWTIVRDVTNMFFILVLLVIAFGTILGVQNYSYKNNNALTRLLIMAVVVNFSRTICGLLIDFAQVVMLTFVYGFKEAAGGNFATALSLTQMMQAREITESESASGGSGEGVTAWNIALAMLLAAIMVGIALCIVILMTITVAIRIVYLWLLVVISPLAFFLKAVPGGAASGYYAMWWKMFTSQVIVGPVMAFFLWLALVSVSSNTLATDGFPRAAGTGAGAETVSGPISQAFTDTAIESFIISICLMFGGLQLAKQISSESAGAAPGLAKKAAGMAMRGGKAIGRGVGRTANTIADRTGVKEGGLALATRMGSTRAGQALGDYRNKKASAGADSAKWMGALSTDERSAITRSRLPNALLSDEAKGRRKEALKLNLDDMTKGTKTPAERAEFQRQRGELQDLGSKLNDKSVAKSLDSLDKKRPDLILDPSAKPDVQSKQREKLKKVAGNLSAKDIEEMSGAAFTPEVLANMKPSTLLSSRDALEAKLGDMPVETQGKMKGLLSALNEKETELEGRKDANGQRVFGDKALRQELSKFADGDQGLGQFRQQAFSNLTADDQFDVAGRMKLDDLKKIPAEALSGALVAAAAAGGAGGGSLKPSIDKLAAAIEQQPQAIAQMQQQNRDSLRDALVSSKADAPVAILAAGGNIQQAFGGDSKKMEKYFSENKDGAKLVAGYAGESAYAESGGVNPLSMQVVMKLDGSDVHAMGSAGNPSAKGIIDAASAIKGADPSAFKDMAEAQIKEMKSKATEMLSKIESMGSMKSAAGMSFQGDDVVKRVAGAVDRASQGTREHIDKKVKRPRGRRGG